MGGGVRQADSERRRSETGGVQVIERAAAILRALRDHAEGLSLAQLAAEVGLARSTVHRIVIALQREGFVAPVSPQGKVQLGPGLVALAATAATRDHVAVAPPAPRAALAGRRGDGRPRRADARPRALRRPGRGTAAAARRLGGRRDVPAPLLRERQGAPRDAAARPGARAPARPHDPLHGAHDHGPGRAARRARRRARDRHRPRPQGAHGGHLRARPHRLGAGRLDGRGHDPPPDPALRAHGGRPRAAPARGVRRARGRPRRPIAGARAGIAAGSRSCAARRRSSACSPRSRRAPPSASSRRPSSCRARPCSGSSERSSRRAGSSPRRPPAASGSGRR